MACPFQPAILPLGQTANSTRKRMAKRARKFKANVGQFGNPFNLNPHLSYGFKPSNDPFLAEESLRHCGPLPGSV